MRLCMAIYIMQADVSFLQQPKSDGTVADEYTLMPNSVDYPKAVVMFANDASATIPPASKLTPEQVLLRTSFPTLCLHPWSLRVGHHKIYAANFTIASCKRKSV